MSWRDTRKAAARSSLGVALVLALACGAPDPEKQLEEASERVAEAERGVEAAKEVVEREQSELEQAQSELAAALEKLGEAEERLEEAKAELAQTADDAYLFRTVQSALLAEPALEELAISARVRDRVVTLEGSAPTLELRKKAGEIAAATIGVERVENDVTVEPPSKSE